MIRHENVRRFLDLKNLYMVQPSVSIDNFDFNIFQFILDFMILAVFK